MKENVLFYVFNIIFFAYVTALKCLEVDDENMDILDRLNSDSSALTIECHMKDYQ